MQCVGIRTSQSPHACECNGCYEIETCEFRCSSDLSNMVGCLLLTYGGHKSSLDGTEFGNFPEQRLQEAHYRIADWGEIRREGGGT